MDQFPDAEVLLTPKEVAKFFHVNTKTVTRWAISGELTPIRTWVAIADIVNLKL